VDSSKSNFTRDLAVVMLLAAGVAVLTAPLAAYALAAAGLQFPFPRIFDRTVTITVAAALVLSARRLGLGRLLRDGFSASAGDLLKLLGGFAVAMVVMIVLFALATTVSPRAPSLTALASRAARYLGAAIVIGLVEETFFRVLLLGGIRRDFGVRTGLIASSLIYALAHLVHAPRHYYLSGFHPAAGLSNLAASLAMIVRPDGLIGMTFGLFLLGLVLGEAYILSGQVYFSIGLHAAFVVGAKCWPLIAAAAAPIGIPRWLAGPGPVPMIAAPAAWTAALTLLALLPWLLDDRAAGAEPAAKTDRPGADSAGR
jgi:membrane protease YdiL (CAAX protease family)